MRGHMRLKKYILTSLFLIGISFSSNALGVPVGIRSNNMGNLHGDYPSHWLGAISTDRYHYLRFSSPYYGMRAMRINLEAYYYKHHLHTVRQIASRWVRKPCNIQQTADLENYMAGVAQRAGVGKDDRLWLEDKYMMIKLCKAIVYGEQGENPYPDSLYE